MLTALYKRKKKLLFYSRINYALYIPLTYLAIIPDINKTVPVPKSIKETPNSSALQNLLGKLGKSTAKMPIHVDICNILLYLVIKFK